ncbi:MAG TPA: NUDIX domain-containing protein [Nevskiales bacterium]|nr:NUDIX domain-containing protein [Nevskiales bacterium]
MPTPATSLTVTTDVVLFSIHADRLEVLLVRLPDAAAPAPRWRLPGGAVAADEDLEHSALRHLERQTGVRGVYLEQLYTFGCPTRDPRQRSIAVAYYALTPLATTTLAAVERDAALAWHPAQALPALWLDHAAIVALACERLRAKLAYSTIALQFLPERFTLSALQSVYETILGEPLDKRNFRKRMLALDCLEDTGAVLREGNHRPARLYRARQPGTVEIIK